MTTCRFTTYPAIICCGGIGVGCGTWLVVEVVEVAAAAAAVVAEQDYPG